MSWYSTREDAEEAVKWKTIEYKREFVVVEDKEGMFWALRKELFDK